MKLWREKKAVTAILSPEPKKISKGKDISHLLLQKSSQVKYPLDPQPQSNVIAKLLNHKALLCEI
jgi:hypothetical protein